jgi:hypothetical protein
MILWVKREHQLSKCSLTMLKKKTFIYTLDIYRMKMTLPVIFEQQVSNSQK